MGSVARFPVQHDSQRRGRAHLAEQPVHPTGPRRPVPGPAGPAGLSVRPAPSPASTPHDTNVAHRMSRHPAAKREKISLKVPSRSGDIAFFTNTNIPVRGHFPFTRRSTTLFVHGSRLRCSRYPVRMIAVLALQHARLVQLEHRRGRQDAQPQSPIAETLSSPSGVGRQRDDDLSACVVPDLRGGVAHQFPHVLIVQRPAECGYCRERVACRLVEGVHRLPCHR